MFKPEVVVVRKLPMTDQPTDAERIDAKQLAVVSLVNRADCIAAALASAYARGRVQGQEEMRERAKARVDNHKRDASFDDSMVGAREHNSNESNIASAIAALSITGGDNGG